MNSRPIKFRAWHKTLKKMLYAPLTLSSGNLVIDKEGNLVKFIPKRERRNDDLLYLEANLDWRGNWYENGELQDVEWMQFTGLYDKNEKPIYEGDIIRWDTELLVIEYIEEFGAFVGVIYKQNDLVPDVGVHRYMDEINDGQIIGNVFENAYYFE